MIVIRNNLNYIFGGFTVAKWGSNLGYITDPFAFLFSLRRNGGLTNYKLMIKDGAGSKALNHIHFMFQHLVVVGIFFYATNPTFIQEVFRI